MHIFGRRYDTGEIVDVEYQAARIVAVRETDIASAMNGNLPLAWLAPGFIDLQVNGYAGIGFNDADLTTQGVLDVTLHMRRKGVARYLPTCTTDSHQRLVNSLRVIAAARDQRPEVAAYVPGIHLEGPFICPEDGPRGAHPRQHVRRPDWEEFQRLQDAAKGSIALVTLSAEYAQSPGFIGRAVASGVVAAIGHTQANSDQIRAAVDAGATLSTHLGNGAHPRIRRHPNYIWDQLAEDRLFASLIVDGHHLPAAVIKTMLRAKSLAKCILVSDVTNLGGMPTGRHCTALGDVEMLADGRLVVAGQQEILAGASQTLDVNVQRVISECGLSIREAVTLATVNPARLMGWDLPFLRVGDALDTLTAFTLQDQDLRILPRDNSPLNAS